VAVIHVQHHLTISTAITMTRSNPVAGGERRRQITFSFFSRLGGRTFEFNPDDQHNNPCKVTSLTCAIQENIRP
jgi:hypothetical protein